MDPSSQLCPLAEKASPHYWLSTWAWCVQGGQGGPHWSELYPAPPTCSWCQTSQRGPHSPSARWVLAMARAPWAALPCSHSSLPASYSQNSLCWQTSAGQWSLSCLTAITDPTAARGDSAISHQGKTFLQNADIPDLLQCSSHFPLLQCSPHFPLLKRRTAKSKWLTELFMLNFFKALRYSIHSQAFVRSWKKILQKE